MLLCPLITDSPEHSWLPDYKADPVTRAEFFAPDGSLLPETNFKYGRIWRVDRMIAPRPVSRKSSATTTRVCCLDTGAPPKRVT